MRRVHMIPREIADLIERFLDDKSLHPYEWSEFVDTRQRDRRMDTYRKRCDLLDPLVNRPGEMDPDAVAELRSMINELRSLPFVPETPEAHSSPARVYFTRSPFRSKEFIAQTVVLALCAVWEARMVYPLHTYNPCLGDATLFLVLLPLAVWIYSLFLHSEIRNLIKAAGDIPWYSRLHRLHVFLPGGIALLMLPILQAIVSCSHFTRR